MKDFMSAGMASLKTISSPSGFANKFQEYASGSDPQIKALMSRANMGDSNARQQLQRAILDKELGSGAWVQRGLHAGFVCGLDERSAFGRVRARRLYAGRYATAHA
jgi:hypothetical protein